MKVRVRRAPDLPVVTRILRSGYEKNFPPEEKEFILDISELPHVLHDGNMEFLQYIDEADDDVREIIVKQP
jgi:hypothetical protein